MMETKHVLILIRLKRLTLDSLYRLAQRLKREYFQHKYLSTENLCQ
jgi:hypothetical protein